MLWCWFLALSTSTSPLIIHYPRHHAVATKSNVVCDFDSTGRPACLRTAESVDLNGEVSSSGASAPAETHFQRLILIGGELWRAESLISFLFP
jgi:hypothetical protein